MENVKKRDRTRNTAEIKEFSTNVNNASIMTASIKNMWSQSLKLAIWLSHKRSHLCILWRRNH